VKSFVDRQSFFHATLCEVTKFWASGLYSSKRFAAQLTFHIESARDDEDLEASAGG
jgi:hypothetical protein